MCDVTVYWHHLQYAVTSLQHKQDIQGCEVTLSVIGSELNSLNLWILIKSQSSSCKFRQILKSNTWIISIQCYLNRKYLVEIKFQHSAAYQIKNSAVIICLHTPKCNLTGCHFASFVFFRHHVIIVVLNHLKLLTVSVFFLHVELKWFKCAILSNCHISVTSQWKWRMFFSPSEVWTVNTCWQK